ncbi:1-acyl-sn-glycerol-3-phosphate acyltransferase [Rhodoferax sp. PAMC 29310]|uniref:lysophospholipid acyltransferase family protein n=1 Tax=Rhodoferax sp. PAMC 29310 TaxID=2822760 RepID=UPI001B338BE4|nr:lysophospholipid acyltransferase family protein [Rhodoferax sp. PAMC 29310]
MTGAVVRLLAVWRLVRVVSYILWGGWLVFTRLPKMTPQQKEARIKSWSLSLLDKFAIKVIVNGVPPAQGPMLLASNHISWLDIVVMLAARPCRFVSKADIKHWPLIGAMASAGGTLFIERESRRDAMRVVHHMAEQLTAGDVLAVFPEGTTSDGVSLLPFHANLFQAAIAVNAPVMPVAISFIDEATGTTSLAPCYIGDDTLMQSMWRTLKAQPLCVVLSYGEAQYAQGRDRRTWAADLRTEVSRLRTPA